MSEVSFDPYYKWLGIPRNEQPPHYYRLLGITAFEADHDVIETAADQRMSHVRTFQAGKHGELSQKLLNELAAAKLTLLQPPKKAEYDQALRAKLSRQQPAAANVSQPAARPLPKAQPLEERPLTAPASFAAQPKPTAFSSRQTLTIHPVAIAGVGAAALVVLLIGGVLVARALQGGDAPQVAINQPIDDDRPPIPPPDPPATTPDPIPVRPVNPTTDRPEPTVDPPTTPPTPEPEDPPTPEPTEPPPETPPSPEPQPEPIAPSPEPAPPVEPIDDAADGLPKLPNDADVAAAIKEIKELFKQEYAATRLEDKRSLAKKLLEQAGETASDPVAQVALLNESRRLATTVADYETASAAIDALAASFAIEPFSLRAETLQAIAKLTRLPEHHQAIADAAQVLIEPAADAHKIDIAKQLALVASGSARKARNLELVKHVEQLGKRIEAQRKASAGLQSARDALVRDPDDAAANLAIGKYLCLTQGDWTTGLAHLAKGSDAALRKLAADDSALQAAGAPTSEAQLQLGDAWWAYGETEPELRARGAYWYDLALPSLTGLAKVKIEKRLDEVAEAGLNTGMGLGSLAASAVVLLTFEESTIVSGGEFAVQDLSPKQSVFKGKAKLVPGVAGKAAWFSGQNDSIGGGKDIPAANAPRTFSLWIKSESTGEVRYNFNGGTADGGKFLMFVICVKGGFYVLDLYNYAVATKFPVDTRWHHHCAVYNGKDLLYLIDGVVVGAQTYDLATGASGLSLGGSPCAIDEVAVFDRALTNKEVARLYQMGKSRQVLKVVEQQVRMNFTAALAARESAERDRLIAAEIVADDWLDEVGKWMSHVGWPEFAAARVLEITADADALRVAIILDYDELYPQGCNAYPRRFNGTATGELVIDRRSGQHAFDLYI